MSERNEIDAEKLADLLAKVTAATGPDIEIDAALYVLEVPRMADVLPHWSDVQKRDLITPYTASIDAALALVERMLPGWGVSLHIGDTGASCAVSKPVKFEEIWGSAPTVPLAILAALLSALSSQNGAV